VYKTWLTEIVILHLLAFPSMTTYEVVYFSFWGRADVVRMMLDVAGAPYENKLLAFDQEWFMMKDQQRFGHLPKLVIHNEDGTTNEIWESVAIENYLAEVLGYYPDGADLLVKADLQSIRAALLELRDTVRQTMILPKELRADEHKRHIAETIPTYLKYHERLIKGPYYYGDKITLVDLTLYHIYLRYVEMYGDENPVTEAAFPKVYNLIKTAEAGKPGDFARNRRHFTEPMEVCWNHTEFKFLPKGMVF